MTELLAQMISIQEKYRNIFYSNPELKNNGFYLCSLFGNTLKQHDIMFVGMNPGGNEQFDNIIETHKKDIDFFRINPCYNEFVKENYLRIKLFYEYAFGKECSLKYLQNTFYWNLCPLKNGLSYYQLPSQVKKLGYDSYYCLFIDVLTDVRPKTVLTFVDVFKYLHSKISKEYESFHLNSAKSKALYYINSDIQFENIFIKKIIGVPHLSRYHYSTSAFQAFAKQFGIDA